MTALYRLQNEQQRSEAYNRVRDIVLSRFIGAVLAEEKGLYSICWNGIRISEETTTAYDAWVDVALPF